MRWDTTAFVIGKSTLRSQNVCFVSNSVSNATLHIVIMSAAESYRYADSLVSKYSCCALRRLKFAQSGMFSVPLSLVRSGLSAIESIIVNRCSARRITTPVHRWLIQVVLLFAGDYVSIALMFAS